MNKKRNRERETERKLYKKREKEIVTEKKRLNRKNRGEKEKGKMEEREKEKEGRERERVERQDNTDMKKCMYNLQRAAGGRKKSRFFLSDFQVSISSFRSAHISGFHSTIHHCLY